MIYPFFVLGIWLCTWLCFFPREKFGWKIACCLPFFEETNTSSKALGSFSTPTQFHATFKFLGNLLEGLIFPSKICFQDTVQIFFLVFNPPLFLFFTVVWLKGLCNKKRNSLFARSKLVKSRFGQSAARPSYFRCVTPLCSIILSVMSHKPHSFLIWLVSSKICIKVVMKFNFPFFVQNFEPEYCSHSKFSPSPLLKVFDNHRR